MARKVRYWTVQRLQWLLDIIVELAHPIPGSTDLVLVGRVTVVRDAAKIYEERHGAPDINTAFKIAQSILTYMGALERTRRGPRKLHSKRRVDPTVAITDELLDDYYDYRAKRYYGS